MQIESNYINPTKEVSKVNKTSAYEQKENKVDYSNYTIKQLRNIPYEEAKANYEQINKIRTEYKTKSDQEGNEAIALAFQMAKINLSDNEKVNKALYEVMQNEEDPFNALVIDSEIQINMQDYYYKKPTYASFVVSNDDIHATENLTKAQINSINFEDFISKMLNAFTEDLNSEKDSQVKEQYQLIVDGYKSIQENYNKNIKEPYYA